jgi:drug/metabolite transporter (DMT)-like permease
MCGHLLERDRCELNKVISSIGREYAADISLFLSTAVWGLSFIIMKSILGDRVSPYLFVFLRFAIAAILILPFCRKSLYSLGKSGVWAGVVLGILIYGGFITQAVGITFTTASKSAFITGISSVFVPVYLMIHRRRLPEPFVAVAIAIAMAGMYLLTDPVGGGFNIGDFLTLICAIIFAAQIYVMGIATARFNTMPLTFVELATTAVLAGLFLPLGSTNLKLTWTTITALAFMAIVATALALSVQTWAQKRTSAVRAGLIYSAEPVFAYMFASMLLGESFGALQKLGGAIIIVAVVLSELGRHFREKRKLS